VLRNGQRVDVLCIQPPAGAWRDRIAAFLVHKGPPWTWHIRANLEGRNDQLEQRFFIAVTGETIVGHLMVVEKHGVAILAHVFTDPVWRNQGVTSALMRAMMEDFVRRDGVAMHLHTDVGSQAYHLYARFGFDPIRPGSDMMKWVLQPERFDAMFDLSPVHVESACWTHWPLVHKLMIREEGDWLRSGALALAGPCNAEDAYVELMYRLRAGPPPAGAVLVNRSGMTVGLASLLSWKTQPSRLMELDVYVHPSAADHLDEMVKAIPLPDDRPIITHVDSESDKRLRAFIGAGFRQAGRIGRALSADGRELDWVLLER
jgi:GNAT superfamily N-acetyltransferase